MTVTHPFHPLSGRRFELFAVRTSWGEERAYFKIDNGELRVLPVGWTDAGPEDPFVAAADGRSCLRVADLLAMAELIAASRRKR